jgi:hypothetical protein
MVLQVHLKAKKENRATEESVEKIVRDFFGTLGKRSRFQYKKIMPEVHSLITK